jgi:hypothetical protein
MGVDRVTVEQLKHFGLSSIANMLAAIKTARKLDLGAEDVLISVATDGSELYKSEKEKFLMRTYANGFNEVSAAEIIFRHLVDANPDHIEKIDTVGKNRIFNLGYFTWVEQQGVSIDDFEVRRSSNFWRSLHKITPVWDSMIKEFNTCTGITF